MYLAWEYDTAVTKVEQITEVNIARTTTRRFQVHRRPAKWAF